MTFDVNAFDDEHREALDATGIMFDQYADMTDEDLAQQWYDENYAEACAAATSLGLEDPTNWARQVMFEKTRGV